ncbi:MAG: hypothetical protein AAFU68_02770 [Pseudomonadota bacterium]
MTEKRKCRKGVGGRPTKYDEKRVLPVIKAMTRIGATDVQMAAALDVSINTFDTWKKKHPEFLGALKEGKQISDELVERRLFERATGYETDAVKIFMPAGKDQPVYAPYTERYAPDTTAAIFWLKNRRPEDWRDSQDINLTNEDELVERIRKARQRRANGSAEKES